jgi:hypothetical protein
LFVGSTPMLRRSPRSGGFGSWSVRARNELNDELSSVTASRSKSKSKSKRTRLEGVARALQDGNLPLAQIAALLLRLPDPPDAAKDALIHWRDTGVVVCGV